MKKMSINLLLATALCLSFVLAGCVKPETKVSAEQWQNAFYGYTECESVSVKITYETSDKTEITTVQLDVVNKKLHTAEQYESTYETYYCEENGILYSYVLNEQNKWEKYSEEKRFDETVNAYFAEYEPYFDDLKGNFDVFAYNEESERYVAANKSVLDSICIAMYDRIECAFANGELTYCRINFRNGGSLSFEFYGYNKTRIKLPKAELAAN